MTPLPLHGELILGGSVLDVSQSLVVHGVILDSKLTFEAHIREVVSSSSMALGITRKASKIFQSPDMLETSTFDLMFSLGWSIVRLFGDPQRAVTCACWMGWFTGLQFCVGPQHCVNCHIEEMFRFCACCTRSMRMAVTL
jgi:hypothetical protein